MVDCKGILILGFLGLIELSPGMSISTKAKPFPATLVVHNKTVSCEKSEVIQMFSKTFYTCENISVEGVKVFHGNNDFKEGISDEQAKKLNLEAIPEFNNNFCPDCPCGSYVSEPNDVVELCSAMLKSHNVAEHLVTAYTPNPVCKNLGTKEPRIKFYMSNKKPKWRNVHVDNGYISKLQCMVGDVD